MKIKPQYVEVGGEQVVVLSRKDYEILAKKPTFGSRPYRRRTSGGTIPWKRWTP